MISNRHREATTAHRRTRHRRLAALVMLAWIAGATVHAWSPQGHRLVALIATKHLTPVARQGVSRLLGSASLADVAVWADQYLEGNNQTSFWHYVNIPSDATKYERDRDCPTQPGIAAGGRGDRWRDCVVDRILYNQERLANPSLDRADRAIALKFLVHFIGDLHQPFHALGVERGGNGIPVSVFGSKTCNYEGGASYPCNLHSVWDTALIAHRGLNDPRYLAELERQIKARRLEAVEIGSPAQWAMESHALAKAALLPPQGVVDEAYFRAQIAVVDERLVLGGLRLAAWLNQSLAVPPSAR
jgi:nuclease S1